MSVQPNRLRPSRDHRFGGAAIDRGRPLSFRLDGRLVHGFAGDTVLSAALASGIIGAGIRDGEPLALDERFAPPVLLAGGRGTALPMERTPAIDALNLVTVDRSRQGSLWRVLHRAVTTLPARRSCLGLNYDAETSLGGPWFDIAPDQEMTADLAVIGGGLAGMAAALSAARPGQRVVLIERQQFLGGNARFFGSTGDEESADEMIDRLAGASIGFPQITVLTGSEAFALFEGMVRVSVVDIVDGLPLSRVLTINAPRIVVATGVVERLPIFAGNRRPGVVGALAAFQRAERFGVWIGHRALLSTTASAAYRVATQAKNAGIAVERIADTRVDPQSRFVEFSKAYGIPLMHAARPLRAGAADRRGRGLAVELDSSLPGDERAAQAFIVDQFVVAGGWQPELTLWHMAGGASRWNASRCCLEATGELPGIRLAGAVAGYRNASACFRSGEVATAALFGRSEREIDDTQIDPIHESPDDPTPIAAFDNDERGHAYLDGGTSLALRPAPPKLRRLGLWPGRQAARWGLAEQARPLGVAEVAAGVQLGAIPPGEASVVAEERCVTPVDIVDAGRRQPPLAVTASAPVMVPPAYLAGRFGSKPTIWLVEPVDGRGFEIGALVYPNADRSDPRTAVGVVFAPAPEGRNGGLALISRAASPAEGLTLVVRDFSGPIPVRIADPAKPRPIAVPPAVAAPASPIGEPVTPVAARLPSDPPVEVPLPPLEAQLARVDAPAVPGAAPVEVPMLPVALVDGSVAPTSAEMLGPPAPPANAVVSTTFALPAETAVLLSAPPRPQSPSTSAAMPILPLPAAAPMQTRVPLEVEDVVESVPPPSTPAREHTDTSGDLAAASSSPPVVVEDEPSSGG